MSKRRILKNNTNYISRNQGTTMIETVVAFAVLMIILAVIYQAIAFCSRLRMRAEDTNRALTTFRREINNTENAPSSSTTPGVNAVDSDKKAEYDARKIEVLSYVTGADTSTDDEGNESTVQVPIFYMTLDTDETDEANLPSGYKEALKGKDAKDTTVPKLSLYNIESVTYSYVPSSGEESEYMIIPKAIEFIHKNDR